MVWVNSGTTPARNAVTRANLQLWPLDPNALDGFDFHDLSIGAVVPIAIGPKGTGTATLVAPTNLFASQRESKGRLISWGWVVYSDVFDGDPDRLTEYCTEIYEIAIPPDKEITDPTTPIGWHLQTCKQHNCYDQDCSDYAERVKEARRK